MAKANLANKKNEVSAAVRQKTRHLRERDAAKEVARLELQLAQQDVAVLQSQFDEGKVNLREVERARLAGKRKMDGLPRRQFSAPAGPARFAANRGPAG